MSRRPLSDAVLQDVLENYESSSESEPDDHEYFSDHETESEQDGDDFVQSVVANPTSSLPRPRCPLPDYLLEVPLVYIRSGEFVGKDGVTKWEVEQPPQNVRTRAHNIVTRLPGPIGEARNCRTIMEAWALMFPDILISKIVSYTNIYIGNLQRRYSRARDCKSTDIVEMKALFGLLYYIGRLRGAHLNTKDLWAPDGTGSNVCIATMSRHRFHFLLKCIRFDNINTREERRLTDKFAPLREIYETFNEIIKKHYSPGEHVTIDEKLERFRGRCPFRQYIPSKPGKYGAKIHLLADARTFYTFNMEPYLGENEGPYKVSNKPFDVVKRLVEPIKGSGRNVVMDNWYSSVPLFQELKDNYHLTCLGTLKKNKPQIPPIFATALQRDIHSSIFGFQNDCTIVSYVPKRGKIVLLISTMHHDAMIDESTGDNRKPVIITDYNRYKCGVDVVDELCGTYSVSRITKRWPLVIFYGLMNIAGINAYVITTSNIEHEHGAKLDRRDYLKQLGFELCMPQIRNRQAILNLPQEIKATIKIVLGDTSPSSLTSEVVPPPAHGRCSVCSWKKDRKTKTTCKKCTKLICKEHTVPVCGECHANYLE